VGASVTPMSGPWGRTYRRTKTLRWASYPSNLKGAVLFYYEKRMTWSSVDGKSVIYNRNAG